jgi:hypothetical protein
MVLDVSSRGMLYYLPFNVCPLQGLAVVVVVAATVAVARRMPLGPTVGLNRQVILKPQVFGILSF